MAAVLTAIPNRSTLVPVSGGTARGEGCGDGSRMTDNKRAINAALSLAADPAASAADRPATAAPSTDALLSHCISLSVAVSACLSGRRCDDSEFTAARSLS